MEYHEGYGKNDGHTINKHVSKNDTYLMDRNISNSSTYTNSKIAQDHVSEVLKGNKKNIEDWLRSEEDVLRINSVSSTTLGKIYNKETGSIYNSNTARTILNRDKRSSEGYTIKTSFPTNSSSRMNNSSKRR